MRIIGDYAFMISEIKNKKNVLIAIIVFIICLLYLGAKVTYTSFESLIEGRAPVSTAGIHLKVNGYDVAQSDSVLDNNVILDNITWTSTHTREGKLSPGSSGTIELELDPTGTDVAVLYEFQFIDKLIDEDKLINFGNITCDRTLVKTAEDTYSGIFTLADIQNGVKIHLNVDFYFDYLTDIEGITEDNQVLDDLFEIHFHALQYQGETLVPYSG